MCYTETRTKRGSQTDLQERAVSLKQDIPAVYLSPADPRTPIAAKLLAGVTIVLALSPIDLIPDFLPGLGYLDDVLLLPALIALAVKLIPGDVFSDCRQRARHLWANGKPKKWYFSIPIIGIWAAVLCLAVKRFL